ncbi:M20 family metallopeptidase [Candidatus Neomarinimicrobiota bacterium]
MVNIRSEIQDLEQEIITLRRDFHKHPEIGFDVSRTADIVAKHLESYGYTVQTGVGQSGVVGDINGNGSGPTIALRADMDALPMQETSNIEYRSVKDGMMHACGHDGHTAILLGVAQVLAGMRENINGTVRLIFQPGEEGDAGAREMIKDGCLAGVDEIFGLHLWNYQQYGTAGSRPGPVLAAADIFEIAITGIGGHGATPQGSVDAIVVAAELIQAFQTIVSRNTNPLESTVVSIGQISGGTNFNIIADKVYLRGTARSFSEENRTMIKKRMNEIVSGLEKLSGAKINLDYQDGYPPTINNNAAYEKFTKAAKKIVGSGLIDPYMTMGGEDFAYYLEKIPGCFFFVGSEPTHAESMSVPHHCSHFDIDERALLSGASIMVQLIDDLLIQK